MTELIFKTVSSSSKSFFLMILLKSNRGEGGGHSLLQLTVNEVLLLDFNMNNKFS